MDKVTVYSGAIPLETDILSTNQNTEIALGGLIQTVFGQNVVVSGLPCTPGSGLTVQIGPGFITQYMALAGSSYGDLGANTSTSIMKMGINTGVITTSSLTAPGTVGQSINYLIEAQLLESDTGATVLPYYNAANPSVAFSGPANSGTAQNTVRTQRVALQVKAGTAATAGSQTTPAVDNGWIGLFIVTVPAGAVSLSSGSIVIYPGAPFVYTKLQQVRQVLTANLNMYVSPTGNDGHSGLAVWDAFATMQAAWNQIIQNYDLNGYQVTVNLAAGTYTTGLIASGTPLGYSGSNPVIFTSVGVATVSVTSGNCFNVSNNAGVKIGSGIYMYATGSYPGTGNAIVSQNGGNVTFGGCQFGTCGGAHLAAAQNGTIVATANYQVLGGAAYHGIASAGQVFISGFTVTLSATPAFSVAFAAASSCGIFNAFSNTFSGSATGPRYAATTNGVINTGGAATPYFPGSSNGTPTNGGQYT